MRSLASKFRLAMPMRIRRRPVIRVVTEYDPCAASRAAERTADKAAPELARTAQRSVDRGASRRIRLCAGAFLTAFILISGRLWTISTDETLRVEVEAARKLAAGPRPEIVDRNGVILATNLPMRGVEVAGPEVWDVDETVERISWVVPGLDREWLRGRLSQGRYASIPETISPAQERALFEMGLPGVSFVDRAKRYYPQADLAGHLVGYAAPGEGGLEGLEAVMDARWDEFADAGAMKASIDVRAQQALESELDAALALHAAKAVWGAVMDVGTGEVVAIASLPDFDPNEPAVRPKGAVRNRVVYDRVELGSIFKVFTAAAALDDGLATEATLYDVRKPLPVADRMIRDYHGENRILTFSEVIQHSSNIGAAMMAGQLEPRGMKRALGRLGLLDPLPIPLIERGAPIPPQKWGPVETATVSYGHGIAVTPLHALAAFSAVVNGGIYRTPTFLVESDARRTGRRVFSEATSGVMRRILRQVIADGTAGRADAEGYYVIGKTGTAEKAVAGGYSKSEKITSFIGAFPGYAPRYAIIVSLDDPQPVEGAWGHAEAGWNAAPTFSQIVRRLGAVLQIAPVTPDIDPAVEMMLFDGQIVTASRNDAAVATGGRGGARP
ncbi:MAG: penicillin-binding protein 2 [Alphaproteobacteria bacterium]|nr:penicillin-binding protein 2 [Alphaproteobacteria bacterium]